MSRLIQISLLKRKVDAVAEMLEDLAPKTCDHVWNALPQEGPALHARRGGDEVFTFLPPFDPDEKAYTPWSFTGKPGLENATIVPTARDLLYYFVPPELANNLISHLRGILAEDVYASAFGRGLSELAIFYGRNNLMLTFLGPIPGNAFATITDGFDELAQACLDVWYAGAKGERLRFSQLDRR